MKHFSLRHILNIEKMLKITSKYILFENKNNQHKKMAIHLIFAYTRIASAVNYT